VWCIGCVLYLKKLKGWGWGSNMYPSNVTSQLRMSIWSHTNTAEPRYCSHSMSHTLVSLKVQQINSLGHHHHYTCFQPGSLCTLQQIYLGARQASHHQAVCDHYSPSKPGPVTALKANSTGIGYHK
jgi:hypothetical protein